ncbi:MAG: hypothetical protein GY708_25245 [Actinomycetia bacterium]|nr:hypothetical protein [Actinomycetes bacterium]MCP4961825.1 hypothetical protein [Actinomycetes bacterium]
MIETTVRHPRLLALLAGLLATVAAVALVGPRDSAVVGVSDAGAQDGSSEIQESSSTTETVDDGVVLTAPGELVSVLEGPTPTSAGTGGEVGIAGTPPVSTAAPSADSTPTTSGEGTQVTTTVDTGAVQTTTQPEESLGDGQSPATTAAEVSLDESSSAVAGDGLDVLMSAPEMSGSTRGTDVVMSPLVGQVGTRDSNSVPWMMLISANFGISVFALALLRLRR